MSNEANNDTSYSLVYQHSLDDKRRVPVPFRWRPTPNDAIEFKLAVWPKHAAGTCLRVFPPAPWARFLAEIEAIQDVSKKAAMKRMMGVNTTSIKLDAAGRLALPEEMAKEADITSQAVLVGLLDRFEIWSPSRYAEAKSQDQPVWKQVLESMGE